MLLGMTRAVCFILMTLAARAQDRPAVQPAMVEGRVISDLDQKPLRRAHVTLRPMDAGLTPGAYLITAEAADSGRRLLGRSAVTVAEENVENLELLILPERAWSGRIRKSRRRSCSSRAANPRPR